MYFSVIEISLYTLKWHYLKESVFVNGAPSLVWNNPKCGHVKVLIWKEEKVHTAALSDTILGQVIIERCLRLE